MRHVIPIVALSLALPGCVSLECAWGTHEVDKVCVPGSDRVLEDTAFDPTQPHPLVPEEYAWLWKTDGCETSGYGGSHPGHSIYKLLYDATSTPTSFTGKEDWFWFWNGHGYQGDCVDTFEITGDWVPLETGGGYQTLGCYTCDEGWDMRRTLVTSTCGVNYRYLLADAPLGDSYGMLMLLESVTDSGTPNFEDRFYAYEAPIRNDGDYRAGDLDTEDPYDGTILDWMDGDGLMPPNEYEWVGFDCRRAY